MEQRPDEIKAALAEAKQAFSGKMLTNDTFFGLVKSRLESGRLRDIDLDDFICEPVLIQQQDGTAKAGVRIECSRTSEISILRTTFAVYDYIDLAVINSEEGVADPAEGLMDEIEALQDESLTDEERKDRSEEASSALFYEWQEEWNKLIRQFKEVATIDPMSNTIELKSDVENRFYLPEE